MPTTTLTPHTARSTSLARDALYAQAVHVLHVTAQHWGMALRAQMQPDKAALRSPAQSAAARQVGGYGPCARVWAGVVMG